jgi:hypothetical protein
LGRCNLIERYQYDCCKGNFSELFHFILPLHQCEF